MNDNEFQKLIQSAARDPEIADAALDLLSGSDRERVVSAELSAAGLDAARIAEIAARVEREVQPFRAALHYLQRTGASVLYAAGGVLERVTVLPMDRAISFIHNAIAEVAVQVRPSNLAGGVAFVPVVVGDRDEPPVPVPLAAAPRWLSTGHLRLALRIPSDVAGRHPGLRVGAAILKFGTESKWHASDAAAIRYSVSGTDERYLIDLPFSGKQQRDQTVAPELLRELRLFPMG